MTNITTKKMQESAATKWAEEHGVVEYRLQGWILIYNVSYPAVAYEPRRTYQFKVDLRNNTIVDSRQLRRYDPKGVYNRF